MAAAGSGQRLGAGGAKVFVQLAGREMVAWSLAAFEAAASVGPVVVAVPPGEEGRAAGWGVEVEVVPGGATRSESVAAAMELVETELVVVHDAARPLVSAELIDEVVEELASREDLDGVIAAAPITDTVKRAGEDRLITATEERTGLWAAQTPQVFRAEALRKALAEGNLSIATDDAMLIERARGRVAVHPAPAENIKVTTPPDLRLAELLLDGRT
ncbi:MAG: 2-C-methyl-D-erythritol 4-phosphate cytidylyltransferase [Solirubrobacterales bacterium]